MAPRALKLLHVEDDPTQRAVIAHHLAALDILFEFTYADSEQEAIDEFGQGGFEFVILDYYLTQGNGLECLRQLRRLDPMVPIIAISGTATPEIAAELIQAGADDYISKEDLNSKILTRSVRRALDRADALRQFESTDLFPHPGAEGDEGTPIDDLFQQICQDFLTHAGPPFLTRLDEFEALARRTKMTPGQMQRLFQRVMTQLGNGQPEHERKALLRPILLEMLLRLFG